MCISLFSYGRPVVVRCKGVRLGMGWVGSVIWWVGLGWVDENSPTDNSVWGIGGVFYVRVSEKRFGLPEAVARGRWWSGATSRPNSEYAECPCGVDSIWFILLNIVTIKPESDSLKCMLELRKRCTDSCRSAL